MKKIYNTLIAAMVMAAMASCGDKKVDEPKPGPGTDTPDAVEVTISTAAIQVKSNVTNEFASQQKMNVFAKTYGDVKAPNIVDGVVATYDGAKWTMQPSVKINAQQKNAFVYAVAPYDASYVDARAIPVDLNKQVDLLYSGAYVPASLTSPAVKLNMNHALSLLTFNIVPVNFTGAGQLKSIRIEGDNVYVTGTMDCSTGKITTDKVGAISAGYDKRVQEGGWKSDLPGLWSLNFNTKAGDVKVTVAIDNKTYELTMPEVEMRLGYQYIFRLVLTDYGLEFDPSKTERRSLNVDMDETPELGTYGLIILTASGSNMLTPALWGDGVFGTIATGSMSMPYAPYFDFNNLKAGDKVNVESWNATGFELESLEGVETIDLSLFD